MSRCFPYTLPNHKRDDVSLIGSIKSAAHKLQNQWGSTKQKEVSHDMKKMQNKKRSREEYDMLDSLEHQNKRRKDDKKIKFNERYHDARKEDSDHLERSGLSEEHDPPAFVLSQCNSSCSTQNSSKKNGVQDADPNRKRAGMVLRIKLPLKKHKDSEPVSTSTDPRCSSQVTKLTKVQAGGLTESAPRSSYEVTKLSKVKAGLTESAPRSYSQVTKLSKVQAGLTESDPRNSSQVTKLSKVQAGGLTESAHRSFSQVTKLSRAKAVLTESPLRTKEVPSAKQPFSASEEPCFSGRVAEAPILHKGVLEAIPSDFWHKSSGGSCKQRSERQQFRDLIINWKPPSLELSEADDWLFAPRKSQDAKPNAQICKAGISDPTNCPSSASSLQPRACYLPEFDTYQMPYVIPF